MCTSYLYLNIQRRSECLRVPAPNWVPNSAVRCAFPYKTSKSQWHRFVSWIQPPLNYTVAFFFIHVPSFLAHIAQTILFILFFNVSIILLLFFNFFLFHFLQNISIRQCWRHGGSTRRETKLSRHLPDLAPRGILCWRQPCFCR